MARKAKIKINLITRLTTRGSLSSLASFKKFLVGFKIVPRSSKTTTPALSGTPRKGEWDARKFFLVMPEERTPLAWFPPAYGPIG